MEKESKEPQALFLLILIDPESVPERTILLTNYLELTWTLKIVQESS
jgi:hypothetical protein